MKNSTRVILGLLASLFLTIGFSRAAEICAPSAVSPAAATASPAPGCTICNLPAEANPAPGCTICNLPAGL